VGENLRRRVPRASVEPSAGKYIVEDEPLAGWRECVLIDLSLLGMGVELFGPVHPSLTGRRLRVEVDVGESSSVSLCLLGVVRNLSPGELGGTRVGIEFTELSEREQTVLEVMKFLDLRW
jgi:c-di-GMP-binding flagellar brake protein YcgR